MCPEVTRWSLIQYEDLTSDRPNVCCTGCDLFSSDIKLLTILLRHLDPEQSQLLQSIQSLWRNLSFMVDTLGVH